MSRSPATDAGELMAYACQTCSRRKVRCDKTTPICSSCSKSRLECVYQAPGPRRRKRNLDDDIYERLAQYESILKENNLLPNGSKPDTADPVQPPITLRLATTSATSNTGRLLASSGRSRYMDSNLWENLGHEEIEHLSDAEEDQRPGLNTLAGRDPFSGALMGIQHDLFQYHPTNDQALFLWRRHIENVEPLCKILHIPSTATMLETVSTQPEKASKAEECLLFAIYHFAVYSIAEAECEQHLGRPRAALLEEYHACARQSLINANFLRTTEMMILQAYILYLLSCRSFYAPPEYWILTGVAVRLAQRMGLHRDGEQSGLSPFEVQMRRRLFYQIIPLDGQASRESGVGLGLMPDGFDTLPPLNVNDDQLWPGMTEQPAEQKGATEMTFCLARSFIGRSFIETKRFKEDAEVQRIISRAEDNVEELYLRYCDFATPLHLLTNLATRSALNAMRLRVRLPNLNNFPDTDQYRRERLQLSCKILDTDAAAHAHTNLKRFLWYIKPFFAWGTWDALISVLTSLPRHDLLTRTETDEMWDRVQQLYVNHAEMLSAKRALQVAIGRLALKAWSTNPPSTSAIGPEPDFITKLRASRHYQSQVNGKATPTSNRTASDTVATAPHTDALYDGDSAQFSASPVFDFDFDDLMNGNTTDWTFWDKLIKEYQAQGDQLVS